MAENTALQVVSINDAALVPVMGKDVIAYATRLLSGSKLTPQDLLMDFAAQMTAKPALKLCTPQSIYATFVYAAKMHLTFGVGGVWAVPYGAEDDEGNAIQNSTKVCTPQLDYRAMEKIAKERHGIMLPIHVEFVWEGEEYEETMALGRIVDIQHKIDRIKNREQVDWDFAYAVADHADGRHTFLVFSKGEIDKRRKASAGGRSKNPKSAWNAWPQKMYRKTVIRMAETILVPDFAAGMGSGGEFIGDGSEPIDITADVNAATAAEHQQAKPQTQTEKLKADLAGGVVTPVAQAKAEIDRCQTVAEINKFWAGDVFKNIMGAATQAQRGEIAKLRADREKEIKSGKKPAPKAETPPADQVQTPPPAEAPAQTAPAPVVGTRPGMNLDAEGLEKSLMAHHKAGDNGMDWWDKNAEKVKALPKPMLEYINRLHVHLYPVQE